MCISTCRNSGLYALPPSPNGASDIQLRDKEDWQTPSAQLRSGQVGVWAKCLQLVGVGGDMGFSVLKSTAEYHKFEHLETKYFLSDDDYLKEALDDAYWQGYLEANL